MFDEIQDNRALAFLQRYISTTQNDEIQRKLKGIIYCGSQAIVLPHEYPAVYVVKNDKTEETKITNIITCHSAWCCPRCSARVMGEKGARIAAAIDALAKWQNLYPMMITFTLPHTAKMDCNETYEILRNTWRRFMRDGKRTQKRRYTLKTTVGETKNKSYGEEYQTKTSKNCGTKNEFDKRAVGTAGEIREYIVHSSKWCKFRDELDIKHFVRAYEFTWGENSWHPHIHALFWTHKNNFKKITAYEKDIFEYWWKCAKTEALKFYNQKSPDQKDKNKNFVNLLFGDFRKEPNGEHRSLYISKDKNGEARKISSSIYICGWGGDAELTGSVHIKEAKNGHYTPFQMLELAQKNAAEREKWMKLFLEYAVATRGHRRVEFSNTGLRSIIEKWRLTEDYQESVKKKYMERAQGSWQLVVWFKEQQWKQICYIDWQTDEEIKANILELARAPNGKELIEQYLLLFEIDITRNKFIPEVMFGVDRANRQKKSFYDRTA